EALKQEKPTVADVVIEKSKRLESYWVCMPRSPRCQRPVSSNGGRNTMAVIDADTHVIETEHTWDYMDPSEQQFRPIVVTPKGERGRETWYMDEKIRGRARQAVTAPDVRQLEEKLGRKMAAPQEAREGENVAVRLKHMDELGVDIQVLWPTLFLERVADRPEAEIAVCKSYNRWLADVWQQGQSRLRWVCVLPLQTMAEALDQLRFAHA